MAFVLIYDANVLYASLLRRMEQGNEARNKVLEVLMEGRRHPPARVDHPE